MKLISFLYEPKEGKEERDREYIKIKKEYDSFMEKYDYDMSKVKEEDYPIISSFNSRFGEIDRRSDIIINCEIEGIIPYLRYEESETGYHTTTKDDIIDSLTPLFNKCIGYYDMFVSKYGENYKEIFKIYEDDELPEEELPEVYISKLLGDFDDLDEIMMYINKLNRLLSLFYTIDDKKYTFLIKIDEITL